MRMWMTDPSKMCRKHLLGEHVEIHMFVGAIRKGTSMAGYIGNDLLEPASLKQRHKELAAELKRRGYAHRSEVVETIPKLKSMLIKGGVAYAHRIDADLAKKELLRRCPECRELHGARQ